MHTICVHIRINGFELCSPRLRRWQRFTYYKVSSFFLKSKRTTNGYKCMSTVNIQTQRLTRIKCRCRLMLYIYIDWIDSRNASRLIKIPKFNIYWIQVGIYQLREHANGNNKKIGYKSNTLRKSAFSIAATYHTANV